MTETPEYDLTLQHLDSIDQRLEILTDHIGRLTEGLTALRLISEQQAETARWQAQTAQQQGHDIQQLAQAARFQTQTAQQQGHDIQQLAETARFQGEQLDRLTQSTERQGHAIDRLIQITETQEARLDRLVLTAERQGQSIEQLVQTMVLLIEARGGQ
jgi:methyl-accepting chemotaxis protein